MRFIIGLAAAVLFVGASTAFAGPRGDVAGTYAANVAGSSVKLVLNADGTGTLDGDSGRWSISGHTITLSDGDGNTLTGTVDGHALTFSADGMTIRFVKRGAGKVASPRAGARQLDTFKPELLSGKTVKPKDAGGSFRVPRGWKHGWGKGVDGRDAYNLTNSKQTVVVSLSRTMLTGSERGARVETLIDAALAELLEGAAVSRTVPTESFRVGGKEAGRVVVRAPVEGVELEGYLGALIDDDWAFSVVALYKTADAKEGRAAADTVLATLNVKAPKPNTRLMAKMARCWEYYKGFDGGHTQDIIRLSSDGSYTRSYLFSAANVDVSTGYETSGASNIDKSGGSWAVFGATLFLFPSGKDEAEFDISFKGSMLILGSKKYLPC